MNFTDTGIILDTRAHGETHAIVNIFTEHHGRWAGMAHGGQGRRMGPLLQPGNEVKVEWRARAEDALGHFTLEMAQARAAEVMQDRMALAALSAVCAMALGCLPEREAHRPSYTAMTVLLDNLEKIDMWPALMARWEMGLLAELGFGLTLDRCASTGGREDLIYVSPRSACAVSAAAGEPYKDKLLPLPAFLRGEEGEVALSDMIGALKTTGHFIETRVLHLSDKQLPEARLRVVELLKAKAG